MPFPLLRDALSRLLLSDDRPVVAYTALWPLASAFTGPRDMMVESAKQELLAAAGPRTLLLPTYTGGYRDGFLDLDAEPGFTGVLNESIRLMPGSKRTASVFFSFTARGPQAAHVGALRPRDAWGDGSLFEWIHSSDAHILLLGAPLHMCSFLHRIEWLAKVPYRYLKEFSGRVRLDGREEELRERLFVRSLDPVALNVWPKAEELLGPKLRRVAVGRGYVAEVSARALVETLLAQARRDPFSFVSEPEKLRRHFAVRTA